MLSLSINTAKGQYQAATVASSPYLDASSQTAPAGDVENTGNDYVRYQTMPNKSVTATVWDGGNPTLAWHHIDHTNNPPTITNGIIALSVGSSAIHPEDPDVALFYKNVSGTRYLYAVAAYRDGSTGDILIEMFLFDFIALTFSQHSQSTVFSSSSQNSAVNIDSDQFEHWAMTFDHHNGTDKKIYYAAGRWSGSPVFAPAICINGTALPDQYIGGTTLVKKPYVKPDVCVFAQSGSLSTASAVFSFAADNQTMIVAELQRLGDLCSGSNLGTQPDYTLTAASGYTYDWPRIACHKDHNSYSYIQDGYCIVYEYESSTRSEIGGLTKFTDYTTPSSPVITYNNRIYTDGSQFFYNTNPAQYLSAINLISSGYDNFKPVVTYDAKSGNIVPVPATGIVKSVIAWNHEKTNGDIMPIALYVENAYGQPWTDASPVYNFYEVPGVSGSPGPTGNEYIISVGAEQSPFVLYSWWDDNSDVMYYKRITPGNDLKIASELFNPQDQNSAIDQYLNSYPPISGLWYVYASDGALVKSGSSIEEFKTVLYKNESRLKPGIYSIRFYDGKNFIRGKYFIR